MFLQSTQYYTSVSSILLFIVTVDWIAWFVLSLTSVNLYEPTYKHVDTSLKIQRRHSWISFSFSLAKLKRNGNQRGVFWNMHQLWLQYAIARGLSHSMAGQMCIALVIEISRSESNATLTYMYINCITPIILFVVHIGTDHTSAIIFLAVKLYFEIYQFQEHSIYN